MIIKPIIFISGPFRGKPNIEWNRQQNVRAAEAASLFVWRNGGIAICPHKNTEHFDGAADDSIWLDGDLQILQRCDGIYLIPGWESSSGARSEFEFAARRSLMVMKSETDVLVYVARFNETQATPAFPG